jgi:hypothetical protein
MASHAAETHLPPYFKDAYLHASPHDRVVKWVKPGRIEPLRADVLARVVARQVATSVRVDYASLE